MSRISKDHIYLLFEHGIDIASKTIYIGYGDDEECDLDQKVAADVLKGLHILSVIRPEDSINVLMNCQGGYTQHGFAIYDKIRSLTTPVNITIYGHCYSMASWILQAADHRSMSRNSTLMIHHGDGPKDAFSKEQDKRCTRILLDKIREKNPEFTEARLNKMLLRDTYLWPEEALALGLIDEVLE
jgi:ATP-dependent protease ClpP protease subunit